MSGIDKEKKSRKIIVFNLIPVKTAAIDTDIPFEIALPNEIQSLDDLGSGICCISR